LSINIEEYSKKIDSGEEPKEIDEISMEINKIEAKEKAMMNNIPDEI